MSTVRLSNYKASESAGEFLPSKLLLRGFYKFESYASFEEQTTNTLSILVVLTVFLR